jgi:hypothetical protein
MLRVLHFMVVCVGAVGLLAMPAEGKTHFSATGIKVRQTWIVDQTNLALTEAPKSSLIDNQEDFAKLWKAWRSDQLPKVDFAKEFVLVLTDDENAGVDIKAALDMDGVLRISTLSTQRVSYGKTYVLAIVARDGIKSVGTTPPPPMNIAP